MKVIQHLFLFLLFVLFCSTTFAQQSKDSIRTGTVDGVVRDSVHNYVLQSATLAIYKVIDSSLLNYRLSNNFGEFHFENLPTGIPLRIIVSYTGYVSYTRKFEISIQEGKINFKNINLERGTNHLQNIIINAVPPVRMNGDTLEFNADAFKLDPNAVAEDLLRKLPGVVVWGDGTITVNGKEVSSVLVNGKPFFGGDTRIATQNLPKSAVDKIQVYQQNRNPDNPLDSITQINIKLKKNKSFGRFGKLAAGYGTDRHFQSDANINFFSNQTQFGLVGATNNINKVAGDVQTLMRNSTFKGTGAATEYQPDFNLQGINQPIAGGFTFQHDFTSNPGYNISNRLKGNYFIQNNTQKINSFTQTITSLSNDSTQTRQNNSQSKQSNTGQTFSTQFEKHKDHNNYHIGVGLNTRTLNSNTLQHRSVSGSKTNLLSTNNNTNSYHTNSNNISLDASLQRPMKIGKNGLSGNLKLQYSLEAGSNHNNQLNQTNFISLTDPSQNQFIDRTYQNNSNDSRQHLSSGFGDLSRLITGRRGLWGIRTTLQNDLYLDTHKQDNTVQDRDTSANKYVSNPYLSGTRHRTIVNELPSLNFEKSFSSTLVNRYSKTLSFSINAKAQFYHQKNTSSHSFQNITQNYQKFVPSADISYHNYQYGDFEDYYTLNFTKTSDYPTIDQLSPLTDSANLYDIRKGNLQLDPTNNNELSFNFRHFSFRSGNNFDYNLRITAGITNNYLADSSITDKLGRSTYYTVNIDGNKFLNGAIALKKAFKLGNHQIQLSYNSSASYSKNPTFINHIKNWSNIRTTRHTLRLYYNFTANFALDLQQGYTFYHSQQNGANNNVFKNQIRFTKVSTSYNFIKTIAIGSNITYNHSSSTGSAVTNFAIWNAQVSHRFMKGNNLEIKFSALDLLRQNTSIINYGNNNSLTHGRVNVLQQYFMLTVSYFPRKFGKKEK